MYILIYEEIDKTWGGKYLRAHMTEDKAEAEKLLNKSFDVHGIYRAERIYPKEVKVEKVYIETRLEIDDAPNEDATTS